MTATRYDDPRGVRYRFHDLVRVFAGEQLAHTETGGAAGRGGAPVAGWVAGAGRGRPSSRLRRRSHGGARCCRPVAAGRRRLLGPDALARPGADGARRGGAPGRRGRAGRAVLGSGADPGHPVRGQGLHRGLADDQHGRARRGDRAGNRAGRAAMHYSLGSLHIQLGNADQAAELFELAVDEFRAVGNDHGPGLALRNLTSANRFRGDPAAARSHGAEAPGCCVGGDPVGEAHLLSRLALVESGGGRPHRGPAARRSGARAVPAVRIPPRRRPGTARLGDRARPGRRRRPLPAPRCRRSSTWSGSSTTGRDRARTHGAGRDRTHDGRPDRAAELLGEAAELARSVGQTSLARRAQTALDGIS